MCPLFIQAESKERDAPCDQASERDIRLLLIERRQIAQIWSINDVQALRNDLSEEEAWIVLQEVDRRQAINYGIDWGLVEYVSDELYPLSLKEKIQVERMQAEKLRGK